MTTLLVCTMAMTSICTTQAAANRLNRNRNLVRLKLGAHNALNIALARINSARDWRGRFPHRESISLPSVSSAQIQFELRDADGTIDNDDRDPVDIIASARFEDATYAITASLVPDGKPLASLEHCLAAESTINVQSNGSWNCNPSIAANQSINCFGSSLCSTCYSPSVIGNIHGPQEPLAEPVVMPNRRVTEYYERLGTALPPVPIVGAKQIWGALLSPRVNSLGGTTNPLGIYVIDCEGYGLSISNSRFQCTLVIKNCGGSVTIGPQVLWEPASLNLPALLADSDVQLQIDSTRVLEMGRSYNPPDFPYHKQSNHDVFDQFPAQLRGAVVIFGNCNFGSSRGGTRVIGSVLAQSFSGTTNINCTSEPRLSLDPPLGMRSFDCVRIAPFSLRRYRLGAL
ncbi:MAG TPA: hypothetical protein DDW52_17110 [Planctomycetaceae bacterium]|nr:hypothetical protein [Planctomycetaceae bacterium]